MKLSRSGGPLFLAASLFLLGPWLRPATAQLLGPEFQVNSYTSYNQNLPAVAATGSGNFVGLWSSRDNGTSDGVFGQRFSSAGSKVGSEFQVNTYTTNDQGRPAVAADGPGSFLVVWESYGQDGSDKGVFGQRFNSAGSTVGSEFRVNSYTTSDQDGPAVAVDGTGNFVVAWTSAGQVSAYSFGVFGQRYSSAGSPVGSEFQVNTDTLSNHRYPAVAADAPGNFIVAWTSYDQDGRGVFGQSFDSAGSKVGGELRVNTYATGSQAFPAVAADGLGNFVVSWQSDGQDGSLYGVFGQRMTPPVFQHGFEANPPFWSATTATMCLGHCGAASPDGCFCDSFCLTNFDCCLDACSTCGQCVP